MPTPQWADLYAVKFLQFFSRTPKLTVLFIAENYYFSSIFLNLGRIFSAPIIDNEFYIAVLFSADRTFFCNSCYIILLTDNILSKFFW